MGCVLSSADMAIARRLEAAEAGNCRALAQMLAKYQPDTAAEPFAGGVAVFAGVGSPMTHALGIGVSGPVSVEEMERMEAFFRKRGSACLIDLCPLADTSVIAYVQSHPYRITEFNNVMVRRIHTEDVFEPVSGVRLVPAEEMGTWARVVSEGFSEAMPVTDEMMKMMTETCGGSQCWLAGDGTPVAAAAMGIFESVALFYGDATLMSARRQGWQSAFIRRRLAAAQEQGCDLAVACVLPGSGSHRNYERAGFQLIYMRVNLMREL